MNRTTKMRRQPVRVGVESLEGRPLLSGVAAIPPDVRSALIAAVRAGGGLSSRPINYDPAAVAAIVNALGGRGPGSEFVALIRRQVPNYGAILAGFIRGTRTEATTPGVAVRVPRFQGAFTGRKYDHLAPNVAGALLLRGGRTLELGAIMRGPFDEAVPAYVVFGIDRGAGRRIFAERPGITPDALVTITVNPHGAGAIGTVTDRTTGAVQPLDPSRILVRGSTLQVFVDSTLLPSKGLPPNRYRFALWTQDRPGNDVTSVGDFLPDSMIPIGVQR